jgi:hypothetical protein
MWGRPIYSASRRADLARDVGDFLETLHLELSKAEAVEAGKCKIVEWRLRGTA